jgi:hypothetical protein
MTQKEDTTFDDLQLILVANLCLLMHPYLLANRRSDSSKLNFLLRDEANQTIFSYSLNMILLLMLNHYRSDNVWPFSKELKCFAL